MAAGGDGGVHTACIGRPSRDMVYPDGAESRDKSRTHKLGIGPTGNAGVGESFRKYIACGCY